MSSWKKGDRIRLEIRDLTDAGEGVGHAEGFAFFVKDAVPGDIVEASVMKVKSRYAYAHLDRIETPSSDRVEPPCPRARACGGCSLQHLSYRAELSWKENRVRQALQRIGGLDAAAVDAAMLPAAGAGEELYRYRNKAQVPVACGKDGRPAAGYYAARTHAVIPVKDCLLGDPVFADMQRIVLAHMEQYHIAPYNERTGKGLVRHLLMRSGYHSGSRMLCLVVNAKLSEKGGHRAAEKILPGAEVLADRLFAEISGMASLSLNGNTEHSNVILGHSLMPVRGELQIEDTMCGLTFRLSPLSFYQVNTAQAERLYAQALEFAGLTGKETVLDLYCGIGTISLLAAGHAARVIGVEVVEPAVEDARENARRNHITNAEFRAGRAEEVLPQLAAEGVRPEVLIVDPPRSGLDPSCVETICALSPDRVVYVSCNPATLARDIGALSDTYRLQAFRPYDLFSRTPHIETVCLLTRLQRNRSLLLGETEA